MKLKTACKGKTIKSIEAEPRGRWEGAYVWITFTDGSKIFIGDDVVFNDKIIDFE